MRKLAEKYHAGQFRKGEEKLPYIVHPQVVAENLLNWGENPDSPAIMIAWGHDLLEDTCVSESEILAVSSPAVLQGIKLLTRPRDMDKVLYLQSIVESGNRDALLVKISDRICNSRDFIKLEGKLYAYQYLHEADELIPALEKFSDDSVVKNALQEWKNLDNALRREAQYDAIRGCMLGGAVGDALGTPIEFMSKSAIMQKYGKDGIQDYVEFSDGTGAITDDTQMALFTAEGILRAYVRGREKGICSPASVVKFAYQRWLKTQGYTPTVPEDFINSGWLIKEKQLFSCRAPGMTCLSALEENTLRAKNNSKGCGTVMRLAPVGLFFDPESAYKYGCEFSAITHGHPTGITAGGAFAMLISYLRNGKSLATSLDLVEKHLESDSDAAETLAAIRKARNARTITELGEGWVAEEALAISIYCALRHQWNFKAGVLEAINITGDSDSTGCIAGHILGVLNGENAIPEKWRKNLREYNIVSRIADDIHTRFEENSAGHVTENWWQKYPGY